MEQVKGMGGTAAEQWRSFGTSLGDAGAAVHERADGVRTAAEQEQVTQALLWWSIGALASIPGRNTDFPEFVPILNPAMRPICGNADTTYMQAVIRGDGAYRITGRRGTVRIVHLQVIAGFMGSREPLRVLADINLDQCKVDERGWIDIVLSAERPKDHEGDWFPLDPTLPDTFVVARQICYDWLTEIEATLAIERIDRPVVSQAHTVGSLESLPLVADYVRKEPIRFMEVQEKHLALLEPNAVMDVSKELPGAMGGQTYMHGLIQIAPDEALILEFDPPVDSPYWGVQLLDYFYNTLDVRRMPASLNGHQGATDPDGKVRIVVAASDPGVRNWLDKGHDERVQLRMRFYAAERPAITTRVVPLDRLPEHLPADTTMVTPAERAQSLRDRVIGLQLRRRW
jgi:hypothetical protein